MLAFEVSLLTGRYVATELDSRLRTSAYIGKVGTGFYIGTQKPVVHAQVEGDTFMPEWRHLAWREVSRRESADANFCYTFFVLER